MKNNEKASGLISLAFYLCIAYIDETMLMKVWLICILQKTIHSNIVNCNK